MVRRGRAEASLPPIRLIVLQCRFVPRRRVSFPHPFYVRGTPRLADTRRVDYAISADNQAWRSATRQILAAFLVFAIYNISLVNDL